MSNEQFNPTGSMSSNQAGGLTPANPAFVATSPLEQLLEAACTNKMQMEVFLNQFINNHVLVLLNEDPGNPPQMNKISPVTFNRGDGQQYVVTFTSAERVKPFVEQFPQFKHALGMHAGFIVQSLNNNIGIAVNPGCPIGFEWHAPGVQQAKSNIDWSKAPWNQQQAAAAQSMNPAGGMAPPPSNA
ncbi:MAG: SseB family protein [Pirellulales bacterium]|nr:SseB family protein [Pirellulales bacterium]